MEQLFFPECLPLPVEKPHRRSAPTAHWTCECFPKGARLNESSVLTPKKEHETMPKDTIPGREGGLLPSEPEPAGFPSLPRIRKRSVDEAVLSVSARVDELARRLERSENEARAEGEEDGEAF